LDLALSRKAYEILRNNTNTFQGWGKMEIYKLCDYFKILSFQKSLLKMPHIEYIYSIFIYRGQFLTKRSEKVDFFGILLSGRAFLTIEAISYGYVEEGDFIGYMNYLKLKG